MIRTIDKPTDFQMGVVLESNGLDLKYDLILYDMDGEGVYFAMEGKDGYIGTILTVQPSKNKLKNPENKGFSRTFETASNELKRGDENIIKECKEHIEGIVRPKLVTTYEPRPEVYVSSDLSGVDYMKSKVKPSRPKRYNNLIVI
ncbi:MAG: hypothetical protein ABR974_05140 [Bacteroidales bacterium]|jgi:hypothetical protein